jgi:hypothetical protein
MAKVNSDRKAKKRGRLGILGHVADRIEVDDERDGADHHQHHGGQHVDPERPGDGELAGGQPVGDRDDQRLLVVAERDREERDPRQQRAHAEQAGGDQFRGARPDLAAEQAGDQEADERQEDDQIVHGAFSP